MKVMFCFRAFFVCAAGMLMAVTASPVLAQKASLATFDRTLETLRQSVARLLKENAQINTDNVAARARIKVLHEELRSLETEASRLEEKASAEKQKIHAHRGGVEALRLQVAEADVALKRVRNEVAAEQAKNDALENEEKTLRQKTDTLSSDVARMSATRSGAAAARNTPDALKTEQEDLKKGLSDAVSRVEEAKQRWQDMNAVVTKGPQQVEALKADNVKLLKAVSQAEDSLVKTNAQLTDVQSSLEKIRTEDYSDTRLGRLDSEVKDMAERNRKIESEALTIIKTKEDALKRFEADQEKLDKHYRVKYEELLQRNVDLKFELDSLRKQMVDMDKKKAELEAIVYPAR